MDYIMSLMKREELRRTRERLALTRKELGDLLGLTSTSICRMEIGKQRIMKTTELALRYILMTHKPKREGSTT